MNRKKCPTKGRLAARLAMAVMASGSAFSANAVDLPFSQTTGFNAGPGATVVQAVGGGAPIAGRGGLEFSTPVTMPPGAPFGDNTAPVNIWQGVAWGCLFGEPISPANCANGGVVGNGTGFPDAFANPARSSLKAVGLAGNLTDAAWTDVTIVSHHNNTINNASNVLRTVEIHSFLRLGAAGTIVDSPAPSVVKVTFKETLNDGDCTDLPAAGAPVNPLGSDCDDFAVVSGLDLTSIFLPPGAVGNVVGLFVDFRLSATPGSGALVCDGSAAQPAVCGSYAGPDIIVYTAEGGDNSLSTQARLRPQDTGNPLPLFVIGDIEPHAVGDVVNFWGAQWWKNNFMSGFVSKGVASFKGYANHAQDFCGGTWQSRPGNSSGPPATIPDDVAIIVTDTVVKNGRNISGNIKQILLVHHDGGYGPAPGHRGNGPVTKVLCSLP